jgi:hypothetical protein
MLRDINHPLVLVGRRGLTVHLAPGVVVAKQIRRVVPGNSARGAAVGFDV